MADADRCASLVSEGDPDLYRAAMFAPEPLRTDLMVLIAFDIELSKAAARASEPVIAAMRLQWWRDVVAEMGAETDPRAHEVVGPLTHLLVRRGLSKPDLTALIDAREAELQTPLTAECFAQWQAMRVTPLLRLGAQAVGVAEHTSLQAMGPAMALAFALRNAVAMARQGLYLLPLAGLDRSALARGETTETARRTIAGLADRALTDLKQSRANSVPKRLKPVLRLGWRADAVLEMALAPDFEFTDARSALARGGTMRLLGWSLTGRW
ncbi:MAG: squalene/phytoene synthase family protein [Pseudomonadota bacterium]